MECVITNIKKTPRMECLFIMIEITFPILRERMQS